MCAVLSTTVPAGGRVTSRLGDGARAHRGDVLVRRPAGARPPSSSSRSEGASVESVRWGVLGAARIAREQVIPAIRRSGCGEVLAVSSASGRSGSYAEDLGIPRAYDAHEELLADPDVDAVYIALPNALHASWIVRAARAGKHVLCEKPLVLGSGELEEVEAAVEEAGVHLAEAFMYRHHPQLTTVRELIAGGEIGDLVA